MKKLVNFWIEEELIKQIDETVANSRNVYSNRTQFIILAIQEKIKTRTIHAASSLTALVGECGLHYYKVGKIVTIMKEFPTLTTVYYTIYETGYEQGYENGPPNQSLQRS